jgi:pimeloyl-ACP methyl ester carboxylesterase
MNSSMARLPTPEGPGSVSGAPHLPEGVHRHVHQPVRRHRGAAPARGHRGRGPAAAAGARLAPDLVCLAPGDARAGPPLPGRRARPARVRAVRQAPGRVRHRHPRRRPGRADGRAEVTGGSPWPATTPACGSATPRPPITRTEWTAWPWPRRRSRACPPHRRCSGARRPTTGCGTSPRLAEVNEQLVTGREEVYFGFQFAKAANKLPDDAVRYYVEALAADPEGLRGSFAAYRALDATIAQNQQRKTRPLTLPVLAIGGAEGIGEGAANTMRLTADDVQSVIIPGCGHYCLEEAPRQILATLTAFLAPYREST